MHKGIAEDPAKYGAMTDYVRHHADQVARLVSTLEAMDAGGQGSGAPSTDGTGLPRPVLIGGDWAFRTGRYLYWPHIPALTGGSNARDVAAALGVSAPVTGPAGPGKPADGRPSGGALLE